MTPFWRACVAAYWARRQHGEDSSQYNLALEDMERHRYDYNPKGVKYCTDCGRPVHRGSSCGPEVLP